jgi:uncharacterized membrane protein
MEAEVKTKVIEKTLVIDAPVERVYTFWADMTAIEAVLPVVEAIEVLDERTARWTVQAPFSTFVQFVATTEEREPNRYVRWGSTHGAGTETVTSGGELFFEPTAKGDATHVRLRFTYEVPSPSAQQIIQTLAALGYPEREFDAGLDRIKAHLEETG